MHPAEALALTGGIASHGTLRRMCGRAALDRALAAGDIIRIAYGTYTLASSVSDLHIAIATRGALCHASAAAHLGWAVKSVPSIPQICYPRDRRLSAAHRRQVTAVWADLAKSDVSGSCTSPAKTLEMSARSLPFDEALAIADSAIRAGHEPELRALRNTRGRGAARIRRVVQHADGRASNAFESVLRAIALDVEGLKLVPQRWIGDVRPDLVDEDLKLVVEADSFQWHGGRAALHRDANRYNALVALGWTVLRFSWEEVTFHGDRVREVLERTVQQLNGQNSD